MTRDQIRKAFAENDEVHLELSSNQVEALLDEIKSSISNGSETAVKAVVKMSHDLPGIITYEIVTKNGQETK